MNTQEQVTTQNASANDESASDTSAKPRTLKVGYKPLKSPGVEVPFLPLRGRWLREAGFEIGRSVTIEVHDGRLVIERTD